MPSENQSLFPQKASFAATLRDLRKEKGWSQGEISRLSHVSIRTIVDIEGGKQSNPRIDVVIRLAGALGQDPVHWLKLAGHPQISEEKIKNVLADAGKFRFDDETDPVEYFSTLRSRLNPDNPALMCISYLSVPGLIHRPDVQQMLAELVNDGLWIAMALPYPRIREWENDPKPNLARYYNEVYGGVVIAAKELLGKIPSERQGCLGVFCPRENKEDKNIRYINPLAGLTEYRPALIKHYSNNSSNLPKYEYELAAWVTLSREKRDRWLQVYPSPEPDERLRYARLLCWRDYFSDFLTKCNPFENQTGWKKCDFDNTDWQMINLDSSR
jgi:transcriptional regulator with XRE-family HTH domain